MRFREFRIINEAEEKVVVIGDSIAVGIGGAATEYAKGGISAREVLNRVNNFIQTGKAKGATVILSTGAGNSARFELEGGGEIQSKLGTYPAQQIKALVDAGAKVAVVGAPSKKSGWFPGTSWTKGVRYRVDPTGVNDQLEQAAISNGAKFLGPLEDFDPGMHSGNGDGLHPYGGYKKLYQAGKSAGGTINLGPADKSPGAPALKDKALSSELKKGPPFPPEDKQAVSDMQTELKKLGYSLGPTGVDGKFGPYTANALKAFQKDYNLEGNGTIFTAKDKDMFNKIETKIVKQVEPSQQASRIGGEKASRPVVYDAVTKGKIGEVLNFVAGPESRGYYDMMFGGDRVPEILKMTMTELREFQLQHAKQKGSSAAGRYQIMHFNTIPYARKAGLDPDKDIFSPENQDLMGIAFLKEKGLDEWLSGNLDDTRFLEGLARVWAGLPAPSKGGNSYYGGVGLNRPTTSVKMDVALNTLSDIKAA